MRKKHVMTESEREKIVEITVDKVQMKKFMELRHDDQEGLIAILKDCGIIKPHKKVK